MKTVYLILVSLTLVACSSSSASSKREIEATFADNFHVAQRLSIQRTEEWLDYCKSIHQELLQLPGQTEPKCQVPTPAPAEPQTATPASKTKAK